ncbi:DNA-directed primase/polymerase protein [Sesamum angolense]|uniref:DNA-directed primase/polymerase protein n=1 Tax=Sesamum angolense TaxID=2727404 RepID=A0AAE1T9X8_9LAMI|nr:DNA-directed primase/polymerase protein [Sesamum angolense]
MKQSAVREKRKEKRKLKQECSPQLQASTISENKSVNSKTNGKQFSPVVFYGSPHGVPPKRPARLLRLLHEIRVDLAEQNKLRYKEMNSKFRHHYEVIQEGLPCHLYFDLEFNKKGNSDRNGDEMVDLLIVVIFDAFLEKYSIQGTEDLIVELDSSTEGLKSYISILTHMLGVQGGGGAGKKFSRHLIIRLPKTAFKDNSHAGAFVAEQGLNSESNLMLVDTLRNESLLSTTLVIKSRKSSVLLPSGRFKCKYMNEEEVFMASLICNMDADTEKLLICKMDLECVKALHFETEISNNIQKYPGFPVKFDLNACTRKIRIWYWFSEYGLMVYSMSRNRYCERIGREHKSNHVIYVVDLRRAVYYQKCHDPDCQGWRNYQVIDLPLRPVPDDVIPDPALMFHLDGDEYSEEQTKPTVDGSFTDSCKKEWWHEAIKVAEQVEKMQKALDLTQMDETCEEDESWWMAVENTAHQTELAFLQKG